MPYVEKRTVVVLIVRVADPLEARQRCFKGDPYMGCAEVFLDQVGKRKEGPALMHHVRSECFKAFRFKRASK